MSLIVIQLKHGWIKGVNILYRLTKSWLQDNDIEMYSTGNEWKFIVAERFIKTLKIYKLNLKIKFTNI